MKTQALEPIEPHVLFWARLAVEAYRDAFEWRKDGDRKYAIKRLRQCRAHLADLCRDCETS